MTCSPRWLVQTNLDGFRAQIAPIQAISVVFPNQHYVEKDDYFRLWMVEYLMDTPKYFETIFNFNILLQKPRIRAFHDEF